MEGTAHYICEDYTTIMERGQPVPFKMTIEELLVKYKYLTSSQLERALHFGVRDPGQTVEELLIELGYVTEEAVIRCAGLRDYIPVIDLDGARIDLKAAFMVSPVFAEQNKIIPIDFDEDRLVVAFSYPMDQDVMDETATITGMEVKPMLATSPSMERAIRKTYERNTEHFGNAAWGRDISPLDPGAELLLQERVESAPVVRMVNAVIESAYTRNASDIHVEPGKHDLVIRMRINGDLIVHTTLEMEYHRPMVTRLKLMAGMDIAEMRLPQDGKYHYERAAVSTDLRIATLPTIFGEKVVLRLLGNDRDNSLMDVKRLGMNEEQREVFERMIKSPHGIVLVTGPTGSGKTTTLYAVLGRIAKKKVNVVTVEDPVEKVIEGITQVQINSKSGLTFESALRSILRQDPDVIMVGEMRDAETVSMGVRAAITGHLVLSTLHTNDCASTINRLRDMGVPSYMAAAALSGIVAQRLVKVLCRDCCKPYQPDEREQRVFEEMGMKKPGSLFRAVGCPCCNGTGYVRRKAVYELMGMDGEIKSMIADNALPRDIRMYQRKRGFKSIMEYVLKMVLEGETTMDEAEKIIYSAE